MATVERRPMDLATFDEAATARMLARVYSLDTGPDQCWLWPWATRGRYAVARMRMRDGSYRHVIVSRFVAATHRPLAAEDDCCHSCDVKLCVNPAHCIPGSQSQNTAEMWARSNRKATHCPQGHEYSTANTYMWDGRRHCRICRREHTRQYRARKKACPRQLPSSIIVASIATMRSVPKAS